MAGISISPRDRRLKTDFQAMLRLKEESSILRFTSRGTPPEQYIVTFRGPGTFRREGSQEVRMGREHTGVDQSDRRLSANDPRAFMADSHFSPQCQW